MRINFYNDTKSVLSQLESSMMEIKQQMVKLNDKSHVAEQRVSMKEDRSILYGSALANQLKRDLGP